MEFEKLEQLIIETKNLSVLYVEDDEDTKKYTLEMLENFFYNITESSDGVEGLNNFKNNQYDIVFTDINMPNMDGITLIRNIRKSNNEIPIIILSAYDDTEYFLKAIEERVDGYLLKPFEFAQLKDVIVKINAKLSKEKIKQNGVMLIDNFCWDRRTDTLYKNDKQISLTKNEILLFNLLSSLNNTTYSASDIEIAIFDDEICDDRRIRNLLSRLKKKLQTDLIESIYGQGYRLKFL